MKPFHDMRGRPDRGGFSFIEVTILLVVAVLAVGGIFNLFHFALQNVHLPARQTQALLLVQERQAQILADRDRLGYANFVKTMAAYAEERPVGGTAPLVFNDFVRRVAFAPAALVGQEIRCGSGPPPPVADLLCVTVSVEEATTRTSLAALTTLVTRHE